MKTVLLVSDGFFHPPFLGRTVLRRALEKMDGVAFEAVRSVEAIPADAQRFSALVLYIHHKKGSELALDRLDAFVRGGGGLLGIHSATASFKQSRRYFAVLGGRFTEHGPVEPYEVTPTRDGEVFTGLPGFTVNDELYLHETQPGIEVHFSTRYGGVDVPVVWTYRYGQGRVCYAAPGHRAKTMADPDYQAVIRRGLEWVCQR